MILAIDPGPEVSGFCSLTDKGDSMIFGVSDNAELLGLIHCRPIGSVVAIEQIESYRMPVGRSIFETCWWGGRFFQAASAVDCRALMVPRRRVKKYLCGTVASNDTKIRHALVNRFGGPTSIKKGGPLYGCKSHAWAALAIAVYAGGTFPKSTTGQ